jgi:hypothetical protein
MRSVSVESIRKLIDTQTPVRPKVSTSVDLPLSDESKRVLAAAGASISQFYYPTKERTLANDARSWGLDVGYDSLTFMFHEFWPDISSALLGKKGRTAVPRTP